MLSYYIDVGEVYWHATYSRAYGCWQHTGVQMAMCSERLRVLSLVCRVELITGRREQTFLVTCMCEDPGPCLTVFQVWTVGEGDGAG